MRLLIDRESYWKRHLNIFLRFRYGHHHLIRVPNSGLDWLELVGLSLEGRIELKIGVDEHRHDFLSIRRLVCWLALLECRLKAYYRLFLQFKIIWLLMWWEGLELGYRLLRLSKFLVFWLIFCVLDRKLKFVLLGWRILILTWLHSSKSIIKLETRHLYLVHESFWRLLWAGQYCLSLEVLL
jgi:hypothetical protein